MNEQWENVAALGEARHHVVMFLLSRAFAETESSRVRRIFGAIDEINRLVDGVDKSNAAAVSRVHHVLNGGLVQLQRGALDEYLSTSRQPGRAFIGQ